MSGRNRSGRTRGLGLLVACAGLLAAPATSPALDDEAIGFERTPPRLSFTDGEVAFLRPGAGDWAPALVNTPLAAGDQLYTSDGSNAELQIGAGAFVRAGEATQLGLASLEPDFLQLRVATGQVSLDLRSRRPSQTIEIDTPNAAFTVEHNGYYRVEVDGETTTFTSRRGGRATVTPASGDPVAIAPSEQVVVSGSDDPQLETWAAPELDAWDRWNYARTDDQMDAVSARYVPSGVYGVDELDHHGDWRLVPTYGAVWVPRRVVTGWAPYSTGRWIYDPYYGWTWVDDAPWGWAPYHYGRWVYVSGYWGWCPGRVVVRPYYAPALVAFFGGGFSLSFAGGGPHVGWVALGWGEPLIPWWGPVGFRGSPRWAGWSGPRIVNNVVIERRTVVHVHEINVYQNARVRDAIVAVHRDRFGRRSRGEPEIVRARAAKLQPLHGELPMKPDRSSLVAGTGSVRRPPPEVVQRSVVATRRPRPELAPGIQPPAEPRATKARGRSAATPPPATSPPARLVGPSPAVRRTEVSERPPFGRGGEVERAIPPPAPRFERREAAKPPVEVQAPQPRQPQPGRQRPQQEIQREPQPPERPRASRPGRERGAAPAAPAEAAPAAPAAPGLPGEPANVLYRQRSEPGRGAAGAGRIGRGTRARTPAEAQPPGDAQPGRIGGESRGRLGAPRR